jgi:uncharacterized protein YycO
LKPSPINPSSDSNEQVVLDPSDRRTSGHWRPPGPIPHHVRQFGRFPDLAVLQPGDLLLFCAVKPSLVSRGIQRFQEQAGYLPADARWHHAAVYLGVDSAICEATRQGVRQSFLYDYIGGHRIRVRRDSSTTGDDGWRIAVQALCGLGSSYATGFVASMAVQSLKGFWNRAPLTTTSRPRHYYCSQLYAAAYSRVTGRTLENLVAGETSPAFLSRTTQLNDVPVTWRKIG